MELHRTFHLLEPLDSIIYDIIIKDYTVLLSVTMKLVVMIVFFRFEIHK